MGEELQFPFSFHSCSGGSQGCKSLSEEIYIGKSDWNLMNRKCSFYSKQFVIFPPLLSPSHTRLGQVNLAGVLGQLTCLAGALKEHPRIVC